MSNTPALTNGILRPGRARPPAQQPKYADAPALERAVASLGRLPPLVVSWEIEALTAKLAQASAASNSCFRAAIAPRVRGLRIGQYPARRLKILLQMSLVAAARSEETYRAGGGLPGNTPSHARGYRDPRWRNVAYIIAR